MSKNPRQRMRHNVSIMEHNFDVVTEFKYLETVISEDNRVEFDVVTMEIEGKSAICAVQHLEKS